MKLFSRIFIIFGWILLIGLCLYVPRWKFLPTEEKTLNLAAWGGTLDPKLLSEFENETGIKVNLSYYVTNEELQVKMKATGGSDYDLIMPSDYTAALFIKGGLLKPIDKSKINFWRDLNPLLLDHAYDPGNRYTIPFEWEIYGFGINKKIFPQGVKPSWASLFDGEKINYRVAFTNDPMEAIQMASLYLFGQTKEIPEENLKQIRSLLIEQSKWVEAYTDFRADYFLATGNCPIALSITSVMRRLMNNFDIIDFVIPEEGAFISIENFCITKESTKEEYAYKLLNFLYRKSSIIQSYKTNWLLPATLSPIDELPLLDFEKKLLRMSPADFKKFSFFTKPVSPQQARDIWVEVKSF